jgi:hypothetical protein
MAKKKSTKKPIKKTLPKKTQKPVKKKAAPRKKIGVLLVAFGMILLVCVMALLFHKLTPNSLSKVLPKESTIAFVEANISNSSQMENVQNLLGKYNYLENLKQMIGVDLADANFLSGTIGAGVIKTEAGQASVAVFASVNDKGNTIKFLSGQALSQKGDEFLCGELQGFEICQYKLSYNFKFTFIKDYLVISPSQDALLALLKNKEKLSSNQNFVIARNNLPSRNLVFAYVDTENLLRSLFENKDFVAKKGYELTAMIPFLQTFKSFAAVLIAQENKLAIQSYTQIDKEKLGDASFITFDRKYKANLAKLVDKKPLAYFGGRNVKSQLEKISKVLSNGEEAKEILFNGFIKAQVKKYLGETISLEDDIYPLLEGEYAVSMEGEKEIPEYKVIVELKNAKNDEDMIRKLVKNFVEINAVFAPEVIEVELEDGTMSKEIVATEEEVEQAEEMYKGIKIVSLKLGEKSWGIHYAFVGDTVVFASDTQSIIRSVDLWNNSQESFKESYLYDALIRPLMLNSDEVAYIYFDILLDKLNIDLKENKKFFDPINVIASGKNYFDDGVSTTHYIITK